MVSVPALGVGGRVFESRLPEKIYEKTEPSEGNAFKREVTERKIAQKLLSGFKKKNHEFYLVLYLWEFGRIFRHYGYLFKKSSIERALVGSSFL